MIGTGTWGPKDPSNLEGPWTLGLFKRVTPLHNNEIKNNNKKENQEHQDHHDPTSVIELNSDGSSLKSRKRKTGNNAINANNQKKFKK